VAEPDVELRIGHRDLATSSVMCDASVASPEELEPRRHVVQEVGDSGIVVLTGAPASDTETSRPALRSRPGSPRRRRPAAWSASSATRWRSTAAPRRETPHGRQPYRSSTSRSFVAWLQREHGVLGLIPQPLSSDTRSPRPPAVTSRASAPAPASIACVVDQPLTPPTPAVLDHSLPAAI
jgi:hypothetical protein